MLRKTPKTAKSSFYSNKFDSSITTTAADGTKRTIGLTTATFTPAKSNNFYYHTENTLLYTKTDKDNYTPATVVNANETYYYKLDYLQLESPAHTDTIRGTRWVPVSIATDEEIQSCIKKEEDGYCYIKANTKKGSLPSAIDNQLGDKNEENGAPGNRTGTADRRIDFQWNLNTDEGVLYLGNNGKLTMNATGSLKVTKKVEADKGLHPKADAEFTMKFELAAKAGETLNPNAAYNYTVTNADGTQTSPSTIQNNGTFKLKNDETAEIVGLPAGSTYTITEPSKVRAQATPRAIPNGTGEVKAGTAQEVTVTNTYNPDPITVNPGDPDYPFERRKDFDGPQLEPKRSFRFQIGSCRWCPAER